MATETTGNGKAKPIGKQGLLDVSKIDELKQMGFRTEKLDSGWSAWEIHGDRVFGPARSVAALVTQVKTSLGNAIAPLSGEAPGDEGFNQEVLDAAADGIRENDAKARARQETPEPDDEQTKLDADSQGNVYLPGQEPIVDKQIAKAAQKYHKTKLERVKLSTAETAARDELKAICDMKQELFTPDPKNPNARVYKVGDLVIRISANVTEKISTEPVVEEE